MQQWFKTSDDIINDPKLRRYFNKAERWCWMELLCLASKSKERGVILLADDEIAYALEMDDEEWLRLCERFEERRMVYREDDGALTITNWEDWQEPERRKPSDKPERTRERQQNKRDRDRAERDGAGDAPAATNGNGVTPPSRPVTPCHAIEQNRTEQTRAEEKRGEQKREEQTLTKPTAAAEASRAHARNGAHPEPELPSAAAVSSPSALGEGESADELVQNLRAAGVNRADAERLARENPDECRRQLGFLPFVTEFRSGKGAYLRSAIEAGYGPPKRWQEREEKAQRRRQSGAQAALRQEQEKADRREKEAQEAALDALIERLKTQDPAAWERIEAQSASAVPKAIKPSSPAYPAALRRAIRETVQARMAGEHGGHTGVSSGAVSGENIAPPGAQPAPVLAQAAL